MGSVRKKRMHYMRGDEDSRLGEPMLPAPVPGSAPPESGRDQSVQASSLPSRH
jgi:hypothetical protein